MHKGARFYRCDFQVHTPRDPQWTGASRPKTDDERARWARGLIQACRRVGLDAIAITDHHDTSMIRYVREAAEAEETAQGVRVEQPIVVFPGMEVTVALPCQLLVLFDADLPLELLAQLPGTLGYEQAPPEATQARQTEKLTKVSHPNDVISGLDALSYLRGRFIVLPHVSENGHQTLLRRGFDAHYRDFVGVGGYTDGEMPPPGKGARNILDGVDPAYGKKALAVFQTSDCRVADFSTLGSHSTWVKWSEPTAEALRQSCLARHSRISQSRPQVPSIAISRIDISASKFLGKQNVFLSPQYNALIGGRGTGKSTLLEYTRWALCMSVATSGDDSAITPEFERRSKALIEKTLTDVKGAVRVTVNVRGVEHIVERRTSPDENKLLIKVGAEEFRPADEDEIRRLLPIEAYSQKQLSSVGGSAADVLRFVLAPVARDVANVDDDLARAGDVIRAAHGRLRAAQRASDEASRLQAERESLLKQQHVLQQQYESIAPADAATLRSADGYSAERALRDRWRAELVEAREVLERTRTAIAGMPAPPPESQDLPDAELVLAMRASLSTFYDSIRTSIATALATFDGAAAASFREGDAALEARLEAAREQFKQARARAHAQEAAIKQVEGLSKRIAEITQRLAPLERVLEGHDEALARYREASARWVELVHARGKIALDRCTLIETRSKKLVRAAVRIASDLSGPLATLGEMARGSRVRTEKFSSFGEYLAQQADPLDSWLRAIEELRGLIGLRSEDATLPPCPVLYAGGFADRDLRAIAVAARLDDETWLRLRLAPPSDAVTFEYRSREGEYIAFAQASAGQRATALMRVLLADEGVPLIVDQPEDDLDNKIIHEIASDIWLAKTRRQLVFASHNANLVVNGDADLVVVFDYAVAGEQTAGVVAAEGSIDDDTVRAAIADVMEGGREAFQLRRDKYSF
jgi:hypothetical protein